MIPPVDVHPVNAKAYDGVAQTGTEVVNSGGSSVLQAIVPFVYLEPEQDKPKLTEPMLAGTVIIVIAAENTAFNTPALNPEQLVEVVLSGEHEIPMPGVTSVVFPVVSQ